jgi:hypothetical protein
MSGEPLASYDALVRIGEQELDLISERRYHEAAQLAAQRTIVMRSLPHPAPPGAYERLERALALQRRIKIELLRSREAVLIALRRVELGKRAAGGYARTLPQARRERIARRA